jgi:hypothetical protein
MRLNLATNYDARLIRAGVTPGQMHKLPQYA